MHRLPWLALVVWIAACGGSSSQTQAQITLCPTGSVLDPQKNACVAMEGVQPVVPDVASASVPLAASVSVSVATSASVSVPVAPSASVSVAVAAPPTLPPPTSGFAVDVRCTFPSGWVALLPAGKYPKDDQFLMQSLIGLTKEPGFWSGTEYRALHPFAAKRCTAGAFTRLPAPTAGSYFLLAGQEGTFSARQAYDKNGVRRQMTIGATTSVTLAPTDLTYTWVCISCPWVVFRGEGGRDLEPFVVLANRAGRARRGTDSRRVSHVRVDGGRIVLRVMEIEDETTHLDALVLRVGDRELRPEMALAKDDGVELRLDRGTQSTVTYAAAGMTNGFVDVEIVATGYYDPK